MTDEFVAHIRGAEKQWDLGQASEFLVIAATLLDLKAARLLPGGRRRGRRGPGAARGARPAVRPAAAVPGVQGGRGGPRGAVATGRRFPRLVALEPHLAALLPELVWQIGPEQLAALAAKARAAKARRPASTSATCTRPP